MTNTDPRCPESIKNRAKQIEQLAPKRVTNTDQELEEKLLNDKSFQHILKLAPESQRVLMTFEMAKYFSNFIPLEEHNRKMVEAALVALDNETMWLERYQRSLVNLKNQLNKKDVK